jgi:hypothetical protein
MTMITVCYFTAFWLLLALGDPFSEGTPRIGNKPLLTIAAALAAAVWAVTGFIIRRFMLNPQGKAAQTKISFVYAAILLLVIPGISALFLLWGINLTF